MRQPSPPHASVFFPVLSFIIAGVQIVLLTDLVAGVGCGPTAAHQPAFGTWKHRDLDAIEYQHILRAKRDTPA